MELREVMAELGFKTVNEMIGRADLLRTRQDIDHWKIKKLDLSPIFFRNPDSEHVGVFKQIDQDFELEKVLDWKILEAVKESLDNQQPTQAEFSIRNIDRATGAILSNEISKKYKGKGLPEDTIKIKFRGSAGQSFAAFLTHGVRFELEGEANDYFGKGLSGGKLIIYPDRDSSFVPEENTIIGNVAFYGATSGEVYIHGQAGERFCVRNSGVHAVVESIGDHGCEYMTGGRVVILGSVGKNFAAGMSGGIAYVYDPEKSLEMLCNKDMVELEDLDLDDVSEIHSKIQKHVEYTCSSLGKKFLDNWETMSKSFTKVMPKDYKRVLMKKKADEKKEPVTISKP
jgi:glutamate synthase (NADPH/NADH) large chain